MCPQVCARIAPTIVPRENSHVRTLRGNAVRTLWTPMGYISNQLVPHSQKSVELQAKWSKLTTASRRRPLRCREQEESGCGSAMSASGHSRARSLPHGRGSPPRGPSRSQRCDTILSSVLSPRKQPLSSRFGFVKNALLHGCASFNYEQKHWTQHLGTTLVASLGAPTLLAASRFIVCTTGWGTVTVLQVNISSVVLSLVRVPYLGAQTRFFATFRIRQRPMISDLMTKCEIINNNNVVPFVKGVLV